MMNQNFSKDFSAILFDMDGVLINSEPLWEEQDVLHFSKLFPGYKNASAEYRGKGHLGVYELLKNRYGLSMSFEEFRAFRIRYSLDEIFPKAPLMPGVREFLERLSPHCLFAVGTSSVQEAVDSVFAHHALAPYFSAVVTADDVQHRGKPAPDIFLKAAEKLGIPPEKCLVLEDASVGITAAKNAEMTVYALQSEANSDQDLSQADMIFSHFDSLSL